MTTLKDILESASKFNVPQEEAIHSTTFMQLTSLEDSITGLCLINKRNLSLKNNTLWIRAIKYIDYRDDKLYYLTKDGNSVHHVDLKKLENDFFIYDIKPYDFLGMDAEGNRLAPPSMIQPGEEGKIIPENELHRITFDDIPDFEEKGLDDINLDPEKVEQRSRVTFMDHYLPRVVPHLFGKGKKRVHLPIVKPSFIKYIMLTAAAIIAVTGFSLYRAQTNPDALEKPYFEDIYDIYGDIKEEARERFAQIREEMIDKKVDLNIKMASLQRGVRNQDKAIYITDPDRKYYSITDEGEYIDEFYKLSKGGQDHRYDRDKVIDAVTKYVLAHPDKVKHLTRYNPRVSMVEIPQSEMSRKYAISRNGPVRVIMFSSMYDEMKKLKPLNDEMKVVDQVLNVNLRKARQLNERFPGN
tara:strand:+ start:12872 stop:14107 length:1236 start_codon:yes stop_codon:yes gene_type:complete